MLVAVQAEQGPMGKGEMKFREGETLAQGHSAGCTQETEPLL